MIHARTTNILAFDTSGLHCSATLMIDGEIAAKRDEPMARGQAERLFPLLEEVLDSARASWEELDAIGVGVGPGNFTGIRIAVSAARGLAMSLEIPAIGISAFEVLRASVGVSNALVAIPGPKSAVMLQAFEAAEPKGAPIYAAELEELSPDMFGRSARCVIGVSAKQISAKLSAPSSGGSEAASRETPEVHEVREVPERTTLIAKLAAERLASGSEYPAPAALYVRPPDASPPREAPPKILP